MSGLAVKVRFQPRDVSKIPKKMRKELLAKRRLALLKTAELGLGIIQDRTASGTQINGTRFKDYSEKYAFFRAKNGRTPVNVDLNFTGQMMSSMSVKANSNRAVIFFLRASEAKKAAMNDKTRPFFGFNRTEKKRLVKAFTRFITL